jgi:hypothetical protein
MKDELIAGLKNALERKQSLDQAMQSFINAGYNEAEVREASRSFQNTAAMPMVNSSMPSKPIPKPAPSFSAPAQPSNTATQSTSSVQLKQQNVIMARSSSPFGITTPSVSKLDTIPQQAPKVQQFVPEKKGVSKIIIIALIIILVLVLGLLGASLLFKDQLISALK